MNDVEQLLRTDREAPIPDVPDPAFTAAVVRNRLGQAARRSATEDRAEWLLAAVSAAATLMGVAVGFTTYDLSLWWLAALPVLALPLLFVVLERGA